MSSTDIEHVRTACSRNCADACGIIAAVENGRAVRLVGDPEHPVTRGFLCHRTSRFLERQYDPERLTSPLVRRDSGFEPISWDAAMGLIADKMLQIKRESGGAAILHYRCGGSLGMMKHVTDYFFEKFGPVTIKSGDICCGAGDAAQMADFGDEDSNDLFDMLNSKTIVVWGKNPYVSQVHLLPVLKEAKRNGARLVLIDPVYQRTAGLCDLYLQPRPGGDIALALAVARVFFERGFHDPSAASYCDHFDEFRPLAFSRSLAEWAGIADVRVDEIELLAEAYADRPSAMLVGWGMQRRAKGSATIRAIDALGAISGNVGVSGGGVSFYFKRRGAFDFSFADGEQAVPRTIPEPLLGQGILEASDPPIRLVWVTAANPVAMLPESRTVEHALKSREFTVVVDSFLTDTARCAHVVLPTTTMLEEDDLLGAYGHHWLAEVRPVVSPPAEVKSDYEITQKLARRVGLGDEFSANVEKWKERLLSNVSDKGASLDALRHRAVRNPLAKHVMFEDRRFPTKTGRVNLIQQVDPDPPQMPSDRPLLLMALSTEKALGSQWVGGGPDGPVTATVHPDSAPGFRDGDLARAQSEIGELTVRLRFDSRQRRDVLLMPKGGHLRDGRCVNALIPARQTDAGSGAVYYDTAVRILPAETETS